DEVTRSRDRVSQVGGPVQTRGGPESPLEEEVLQAVQKLGYKADCQVGESGFRIDLAIQHPDPIRGYLMGIECDGATYHSDRAAHLRDVWREAILRDRGWRLHRVWSTHWWYHRAEELCKLENALAESRPSADAPREPMASSEDNDSDSVS